MSEPVEAPKNSDSPKAAPSRFGRRVLMVLAVTLVVGGALMAWQWSQARTIWPTEAPALAMPTPVFEADPAAAEAFADLIDAGEGAGEAEDARKAVLDGEGPPAVPKNGWPVESAAAQAAYDRVIAAGGLGFDPVALDAELPNYLPTIHVSAERLVRALRRAVEGDPDAAWADVTATYVFAQRMQHGGGSLIITMLGFSIEETTLRIARRLLTDGWVDAAAGLAAELDAAEARPSPMIAALMGECISVDMLYTRLGYASLDELSTFNEGGTALPDAPSGDPSAGGTWLYDADATRAFARKNCHALIEAARTPAPTRTMPDMPEIAPRGWWDIGPMLDNPIGRTLLTIATPAFGRFISRIDYRFHDRRRTRLILARSAFASSQGRAPKSVDELIPALLPAAPIDPLTGEPMPLDAAAAVESD